MENSGNPFLKYEKNAKYDPSTTKVAHKKVVGIDLGTTFSAIAYIDEYGKPVIIPNSESERITPSVIMFDGETALVGSTAKNLAVAEPEKIVEFVKREMGKSKEEFYREFGGQRYSAEELSALILKKMKNDAEKFIGSPVEDAVITVPAYFNDTERNATMNAGKIAGLNVLRIINEPTAAALAYGLDKLGLDQTVFVVDLGGGTFDVTIMRIEGQSIRMLATNGDHRLGGKDWDDKIINHVADLFATEYGENPLLDLQAYQDLQNRAVAAKIQLTTRNKTTIVLNHNGKSLKVELTKEMFEEMSSSLVEKCRTLCEIVMKEAKLSWDDIDTVLLTGGATRMPMFRRMIEQLSNKPANDEISPDEAVAMGASVQGILCQIEQDITVGTQTVSPAAVQKYTGPNGLPIRITNITSHTLGVVLWDEDLHEEVVFPMVPKMTPIPCEQKNTFGTAVPSMKKVVIRVAEGESTIPGECTFLGVCDIELPSNLPKGSPVEVCYTYNPNQILEVEVYAFGKSKKINISRAGGLNQQEVEKAVVNLANIRVE